MYKHCVQSNMKIICEIAHNLLVNLNNNEESECGEILLADNRT